jgi:hypothetical protein
MENDLQLIHSNPYALLQKIDLLNEVILQLKKDFELSGINWDFELNESTTSEEFLTYLKKKLNYLIDNEVVKLQPLFYKIDMDEKRLHALLELEPNPGEIIFLEILKRELQKVVYRRIYSM